MLVLTRRVNQSVTIEHGGVEVEVTVCEIRLDGKPAVRLGFECPREVVIRRSELSPLNRTPTKTASERLKDVIGIAGQHANPASIGPVHELASRILRAAKPEDYE